MSPGKEDLTHKKGKAWSNVEHDILMQMTHDQLHLEAVDCSRTISWPDHWKNVSSFLKGHRYNRTASACRNYWTRIMESQDIITEVTAQTSNDGSVNETKMTAGSASGDCYPGKRYIGSEEVRSPRPKRRRLSEEGVDSCRVSMGRTRAIAFLAAQKLITVQIPGSFASLIRSIF